MKRTVTIRVQTLALLGVVALFALGVMTATTSSAQVGDDERHLLEMLDAAESIDTPWVLQPRRSNQEKWADAAYLFNTRTGEIFLIKGSTKYLVQPKKEK